MQRTHCLEAHDARKTSVITEDADPLNDANACASQQPGYVSTMQWPHRMHSSPMMRSSRAEA